MASNPERSAPASPERTVAAIDIGSNSFHMLIARQRGADIHVIDRMREAVRLGAGLDDDGGLNAAATERAMAALERFGQRIRGLPMDSVRAVGTNALRKARNASDFLRRAKRALGYSIDVVSGIEEARLIYAGVAHSLAIDDGRRFVVDIGGGSTEMILGEGGEPGLMESLHMGCVSVTERFFADGVATRRAMRDAQLFARQQLEVVAATFLERGWDHAVGASGTLRALEQLCRERGGVPQGITLQGLRDVERELLAVRDFDEYPRLGVNADRAPVIAGGLCVLTAVVEALEIDRVDVADGALREGLLLDLVGRLEHRDVRDKAVDGLVERYRLDSAHSARVAATATRLFDQCRETWRLGDAARSMLGWAGRLCELGLSISHSGFHKHGAYILSNADLAGFSRQEQAMLAALVRAHRRKFPRQEFMQLSEPWDEIGPRLAVLLRIAVLLHRSRSRKPLPPVQAECRPAALTLRFPDGWLEAHPLTLADLGEEARHLLAADIRLGFE